MAPPSNLPVVVADRIAGQFGHDSLAFGKQFLQVFQAIGVQAGDGIDGAFHVFGDLLELPAVIALQDQGFTLTVRQEREGFEVEVLMSLCIARFCAVTATPSIPLTSRPPTQAICQRTIERTKVFARAGIWDARHRRGDDDRLSAVVNG
jgi:hypothetical protein